MYLERFGIDDGLRLRLSGVPDKLWGALVGHFRSRSPQNFHDRDYLYTT